MPRAAAPAGGGAEELLGDVADRDRFKEVLEIKEQANAKLKAGDFFSAKCLYSGALELLERCCGHMEKADETWEGVKNNMALCDLKRGEWSRVVETTTEVLARNPTNVKALYRRGVARIGQDKLADAQRDLRAVLDADPGNSDAKQRLAELARRVREAQAAERGQAEKMRGFLQGECLNDTVPVSEDGGVRKLHGNENAPLMASWVKREWLLPGCSSTAVVTCNIVVRTPAGREVWSSRKPPGAQQAAGPHMASQAQPAQRPAEPVRFVMDDAWGGVFQAWNAAAKTLQLRELGRYEVDWRALGPSVEPAVQRCLARWLPDSPARQQAYKDVPDDVRDAAQRRQALQILGLPEELCDQAGDASASLTMEAELLDAAEYADLQGDGQTLLRVFREGKAGAQVVSDLSTVSAHFRIAKLLPNIALKDTRMGLANTAEGLVMRADKTREPFEFVVGEEDAAEEGDFVPPCVGRSLLLPPGGVTEGMQFEVIFRDGVPISDIDKAISVAYADGAMQGDLMPDTTGPVAVRVEVSRVEAVLAGPSADGWLGVASLRRERARAEWLQSLDGSRHWRKALTRWRRIIAWLEELLLSRRWQLQGASIDGPVPEGGSMYDLEWDAEEGAAAVAPEGGGPSAADEISAELLRTLDADELAEWCRAQCAAARLLGAAGDAAAERHARRAVDAAAAGALPRDVEVAARSALAARVLGAGAEGAAEAVAELRRAQALDPSSEAIRDQLARAAQRDQELRSVDAMETLRTAKRDLAAALDADDAPVLRALLETLEALQFTWEAASESAIGKEVGRCARHADESVAAPAKAVIGKLHKLAKQERPLWVR